MKKVLLSGMLLLSSLLQAELPMAVKNAMVDELRSASIHIKKCNHGLNELEIVLGRAKNDKDIIEYLKKDLDITSNQCIPALLNIVNALVRMVE